MNHIAATKNRFGRFRQTFIGDRAFYKAVFAIVVPIIVQNTISNFVNLLDNIMVGQVGTAQMSGVSIANQLLFVFNLTVFGGLAGAGIFGAQFYGAGNIEGLRNTHRFKIWTAAVMLASSVVVFLIFGDSLISMYLTGEGDAADAALMLEYGRDYLRVMLWGLLPFVLSQAYSGTLRETGETMLPMKASIASVITNLCFNYVLIFGKLGFPVLGVTGAAIATVIARYVELAIIVVYTHRHKVRFSFISGIYRSLKVPRDLAMKILVKGMPLLVNELAWSMSVTTLMQIYSTRGLNVIAGLNISSTISNLFNVVFVSMGIAVGVMAGQALGAGDTKRARSYVWKLIFSSICTCFVLGGALAAVSSVIPRIYNTTEDVRNLATHFIRTGAMYMAFNATSHCCYFAMRSGGKTLSTFIFDSAYSWLIFVPFAYVITHYTKINIYAVYPISLIPDMLKSVIGVLIVRTGYWAQNMVSSNAPADSM